jgi:hypothetical protein
MTPNGLNFLSPQEEAEKYITVEDPLGKLEETFQTDYKTLDKTLGVEGAGLALGLTAIHAEHEKRKAYATLMHDFYWNMPPEESDAILAKFDAKLLAEKPGKYKGTTHRLLYIEPGIIVTECRSSGTSHTFYYQQNSDETGYLASGGGRHPCTLANGDLLACLYTHSEVGTRPYLEKIRPHCLPKWLLPKTVCYDDAAWQKIVEETVYASQMLQEESILMDKDERSLPEILALSGITPTGTEGRFLTSQAVGKFLRFWVQMPNGKVVCYNAVSPKEAESLYQEELRIVTFALSLGATKFDRNSRQYQISGHVSFYIPDETLYDKIRCARGILSPTREVLITDYCQREKILARQP